MTLLAYKNMPQPCTSVTALLVIDTNMSKLNCKIYPEKEKSFADSVNIILLIVSMY